MDAAIAFAGYEIADRSVNMAPIFGYLEEFVRVWVVGEQNGRAASLLLPHLLREEYGDIHAPAQILQITPLLRRSVSLLGLGAVGRVAQHLLHGGPRRGFTRSILWA
jgi:hypothetical protein